ncbi:MAG: DUF4112 domain-containing protein, partial [Caulobacteraceae bacterium]
HRDIQTISGQVSKWSKLSDRLFSIGPFGVGLDGLLAVIPGAGGLYGLGAGGVLMVQGMRSRASLGTLTKIGLLTGMDSLIGAVPVVGDLFDFFFRAHARSSRILQREIDQTHYIEGSRRAAERAKRIRDDHHYARAMGKRRVVYLGR